MFKLGLFTQAATDFKLVTEHHPKEPFGHFNYALTLLQLGKFKKALDALEPITSKNSTSLLKDLGVDA
jgi:predicted Zn-dependent protease